MGALIGSVARPFGGWLSDRLGGARVTLWCFVGMGVFTAVAIVGVNDHSFALVLRRLHGDLPPRRDGQRLDVPDDPVDLRRARRGRPRARRRPGLDFKRRAAAVIGIAGAIGAFGGFLIQLAFRQASLDVSARGQGRGHAGGEARDRPGERRLVDPARSGCSSAPTSCSPAMTWFCYLRRRAGHRPRSRASRTRRSDDVRDRRDPRRRRRHRRPGGLRGASAPATRTSRSRSSAARTHLPYDRVRLGALLRRRADVESLQLRPDELVRRPRRRRPHRHARHRARPRGAARRRSTTARDAALRPRRAVHRLRRRSCRRSRASTAGRPRLPRPRRLRARSSPAARPARGRAAVIGGGLLGLEAAHALARLGCATTVVHLIDRLMERQLDAPAAALLAPAMEALGVEVRLEHATERDPRATPTGGVRGLRFADGDDARLRPRRRRRRHPAARRARPRRRARRRARHRRRRRGSRPRTRACSRSASARSTAASSTASSRRSTTRRRSPRRRCSTGDGGPPTRARCRPRSSR